jgi:hypothetical protein
MPITFKGANPGDHNPEQILEQCRFYQLLTNKQYAHIREAISDRHASVCVEREADGTLKWTITYKVDPTTVGE